MPSCDICTLLVLTASMAIYSNAGCVQVHRKSTDHGEKQVGLVIINCRWKMRVLCQASQCLS
jgi:hypothetical protein